jgi:hypothetical protein
VYAGNAARRKKCVKNVCVTSANNAPKILKNLDSQPLFLVTSMVLLYLQKNPVPLLAAPYTERVTSNVTAVLVSLTRGYE